MIPGPRSIDGLFFLLYFVFLIPNFQIKFPGASQLNTLPRRDFIKLALAGGCALAAQGCARRGTVSPFYSFAPEPRHDLRLALRGALRDAVARHDIPGAVGLVQVGGVTIFHEACGNAILQPGQPVAMHPDHHFDLASLTKVVATTTAIMTLLDQQRLTLDDPLAVHLPALAASDKKNLTLRQCLTHTAGLPPFRPYYKTLQGKDAYLKAIAAEPLAHPPGTVWDYSDLGFILLGFVVESAAGAPLADYTHRRIFSPLGMKQTTYLPRGGQGLPADPHRLAATFAATENCPWRKRVMIGEVHDENAYALGGVSGHAGLFSTAQDLARFGRMLLGKGEGSGAAILSPESVSLLDRPQVPAVNPLQCVGWRWRSSLESTIGFLGSPRAFGHTGFTGTSLWLDPDNQTVAVLLTNAVHPDRARARSAPLRLGFHRAIVGGLRQAPAVPAVRSGLDVLESENFARLRGLRVAVVVNQTAVNAKGTHLLDLLAKQPDIKVTAIFSPEHGFMGEAPAGGKVGDSARGAIPVYSLYGQRRAPAPEMAGLFDVLLYDIQDAGARFYTYIWTLFAVQQFCAQQKKPLIVLDRPDPLGGMHLEGPLLEEAQSSFVGLKPIPTRYGLTCGELARLFNQQGWLGEGLRAELDVVRLENWRRGMRPHQAAMPWVAPSPNMPVWDTIAVYPGTCIFEGTGWSEGRGTATPFEMVGGPGVDAMKLAGALNAQHLPGCRLLPAEFTPRPSPANPAPKHQGLRCGGVFIRVDDHEAFRPVATGLAVLMALRAQAPARHTWIASHFDRLLGTDRVRKQIEAGASLKHITAPWEWDLAAFDALRRPALLYA